ncbi:hypothetical protein T459_29923 [Capsicum annuum]|uniref:Uncharacterized protein n=1 Tax=Capsicum annuum TaxID=4072 RepID=A0A2G2Y6Y8_CAPAN|nr:hypothetical protein T459_29923 [Capsicum annuum]
MIASADANKSKDKEGGDDVIPYVPVFVLLDNPNLATLTSTRMRNSDRNIPLGIYYYYLKRATLTAKGAGQLELDERQGCSDQQGILALLSFLHAHENMKDVGPSPRLSWYGSVSAGAHSYPSSAEICPRSLASCRHA